MLKKIFLLGTLAFGLVASTGVHASGLSNVFSLEKVALGNGDSAYLGDSVVFIDDVTGDGVGDFASVGNDTVLVYAGNASWTVDGRGVDTLSKHAIAAKFAFDTDGSRAIANIVRAGDLNADGVHDLLVAFHGTTMGGERGAVVFYGPVSGDLAFADADMVISGDAMYPDAYLLPTQDVNDDGADDIVFASDWSASTSGTLPLGTTRVFFGPFIDGDRDIADADIVITGLDMGRTYYMHDAHATMFMEMTGDMYTDAYVQFGTDVYIIPGPLAGSYAPEPDSASTHAYMPDAYALDTEGTLVAAYALGDVNSDGRDDLALLRDARIFFFTEPITEDISLADADRMLILAEGEEVIAAQKIVHDGTYPEFVLLTNMHTYVVDRVWISGAHIDALARTATSLTAPTGTALALGDVNADGKSDMLWGDMFADTTRVDAGKIHVFLAR